MTNRCAGCISAKTSSSDRRMEKYISEGSVSGTVTPPSSKSYAQRCIAAALLCQGKTVIRAVEMCDDTHAAFRVAQALGARVERLDPHTYSVHGGLNPQSDILDIGESGLSTRLFTPIASLCRRPITVTGHGSILSRPIDMMTAPLRSLGVRVQDNEGRLPLTVQGPIHGGQVHVDGSVSSQFVTGLLMSLPLAQSDTTIYVNDLKSIPYIDMTIDTMNRFGVEIQHRDYSEFYVPGAQSYTPTDFSIEGDWSGASCLLAAGATAGSVTIRNLSEVSLQADVAMISALSKAGAEIISTSDSLTVSRRELRSFVFDATSCPDLFPALAALAASCDGISEIKGTSRLLHKESDRALAIATEYGRLGIKVDIASQPDTMLIYGGPMHGAEVDSHKDHRMAMSLAVAALSAEGTTVIRGAECVAKSYGDFWDDFEKIYRKQS